jgi:ubiquinone/menaquinone biosynthesis C-methylase UbiE
MEIAFMSSITEFAGSVPDNYDQFLGPLFFEPFALDLFERLKEKRYDRILELASGTGRVTRHLAELVAKGGQLYATDLNPDMLQVALKKLEDKPITWQVVDAHEIPFEEGFFDVVVCQFGVMFFKDKPKAFREVHRVLKSQGVFLFNTWDHYRYNAASNLTQKVMNEVFPDDPPDFMEKGPYSFFEPGKIRGLLEDAGFTHIDVLKVAKTNIPREAEDVARGFVDGSPLTGYLQERQADRENIKKRITEVVRTHHPTLQLPMQAMVCTAIKAK